MVLDKVCYLQRCLILHDFAGLQWNEKNSISLFSIFVIICNNINRVINCLDYNSQYVLCDNLIYTVFILENFAFHRM